MTAAQSPTVVDHIVTWGSHGFSCRDLSPRSGAPRSSLLIIGGGFQARETWKPLETRLGGRYRLLIPELPQAGTADAGTGTLSWDDLTDAALRVLDQLGIDRFAVLGVSSGYPIAYRLAQQHSDRVSRLLLFGTTLTTGPHILEVLREGLRREAAVHHPHNAAADHHTSPEDPQLGPPTPASLRDAAHQLAGALTNPRAYHRNIRIRAAARLLTERLVKTGEDPLVRFVANRGRLQLEDPLVHGRVAHVPALVGVGEYDSTTTLEDNRAVADTIDNATLIVLQDTDHLLYLEREAEFAGLVERFLEGQSPAGPGVLVSPTTSS
ncbi:alpha/beta hydrolase [Amycolatopsis sp. PS_44_ISF1]|uniref:alpha/beta fold hydrolase n=1 Tax=Amycolatopsis sp. PS_44_ISF1 TaxID=2974917 RepID=UPI0028DF3039|nr:alpha/beta hydrolase [Amycolatopsis sp. PS_44_ISF1]MDT8913703.1 alpha/beta hydrolase [Amycolatopsis sp. PS_44_ISF1]